MPATPPGPRGHSPLVNALLAVAVCGALAVAACKRSDDRRAPAAPPQGAGAPAPQGMPGATRAPPEVRIQQLEKVLAAEPKNLGAWIELGNLLYDTHQPQRSIDAYAKALELDPNNADVLTDQGVMYRELQDHQRAIANFEKAHKVDPTHMQSLFNLGVVQLSDLKDPKKAIATWEQIIQKAPDSHHAHEARRAIEQARGSSPPR
jgi:cytochrome c-type biogenesis protein CcmH/NrfG